MRTPSFACAHFQTILPYHVHLSGKMGYKEVEVRKKKILKTATKIPVNGSMMKKRKHSFS